MTQRQTFCCICGNASWICKMLIDRMLGYRGRRECFKPSMCNSGLFHKNHFKKSVQEIISSISHQTFLSNHWCNLIYSIAFVKLFATNNNNDVAFRWSF